MQLATIWLVFSGLILAFAPPEANAEAEAADVTGVAETSASESASAAPAGDTLIDFERDVEPIFSRHCYKCHGPEKQKGGLRLDERASAVVGGESGVSVLDADVDTNVLLRRVGNSNPAVRMPKQAMPLSEQEIDVLRRWVEAGTPWPEPAESGDDYNSGGAAVLPQWLDEFEIEHRDEIHAVQYYALALLPILFCILFIERAKAAKSAGTLTGSGRLASLRRWLSRLPRSIYLLLLLTVVYAATVTVAHAIVARLERQNSEMRNRLAVLEATDVTSVFGDPPVPFRPSHLSRLGGVYYRGNCERNPALYNRGNYQTAIMHLALCGPDKRPLARGDRVEPGAQLWIQLEIERAPFAAEALFTESIMQQIFLSDQYLRAGDKETSPIKKFDETEPGERWSVFWPVPEASQTDGRIKGLVYVYRSRNTADTAAQPHYGISYDFSLADGRVSQDAELWMAPLYVPANVIPPHPQKLPLCEWFDDRPMPPIVGGNTSDPKLLGLEEHLGKGAGNEPKNAPKEPMPQQ